MKLNIYLHKEKDALNTAYVKIGKDEIAPSDDSIILSLQKFYGERIQYVIFTEGAKDGDLRSGSASGNVDLIINNPRQKFELVDCDLKD